MQARHMQVWRFRGTFKPTATIKESAARADGPGEPKVRSLGSCCCSVVGCLVVHALAFRAVLAAKLTPESIRRLEPGMSGSWVLAVSASNCTADVSSAQHATQHKLPATAACRTDSMRTDAIFEALVLLLQVLSRQMSPTAPVCYLLSTVPGKVEGQPSMDISDGPHSVVSARRRRG